MNPDVKTAWLEALRSGEYSRTEGSLRDKGGYCCLGVLCELAVKAQVIGSWPNESGYVFGGDDGVSETNLPELVFRWAGLGTSDPCVKYHDADGDMAYITLTELNDDHHLTFDQIADLIEAQL